MTLQHNNGKGKTVKACVNCKHFQVWYIDYDGDGHGDCGLDGSIIESLPASWRYCPSERSMPDIWESDICVRWEEVTG